MIGGRVKQLLNASGEIDRSRWIDKDGDLRTGPILTDHLPLEEQKALETRLWNEFVGPETERIYRELDSTYDETHGTPAEQFQRYLSRESKYWDKVVAEWRKRYPIFRYIDGHFYAFRFVPGLVAPDTFTFERWTAEAFAAQTQRWIEGDRIIVHSLEHRLRIAMYLAVALGIVVAVLAVGLYAG